MRLGVDHSFSSWGTAIGRLPLELRVSLKLHDHVFNAESHHLEAFRVAFFYPCPAISNSCLLVPRSLQTSEYGLSGTGTPSTQRRWNESSRPALSPLTALIALFALYCARVSARLVRQG